MGAAIAEDDPPKRLGGADAEGAVDPNANDEGLSGDDSIIDESSLVPLEIAVGAGVDPKVKGEEVAAGAGVEAAGFPNENPDEAAAGWDPKGLLLGASDDDEAAGVGVGSLDVGAEKEKGEGEAVEAATTGAGEGSFFPPPNENEGVEA